MLDCGVVNESIAELEAGKPSYELCRNLAALYIIKDHMDRCSGIGGMEIESEFMSAVYGKPVPAVMTVIDDLMHTVRMLSPKTYQATIDSIKAIEAG